MRKNSKRNFLRDFQCTSRDVQAQHFPNQFERNRRKVCQLTSIIRRNVFFLYDNKHIEKVEKKALFSLDSLRNTKANKWQKKKILRNNC
jgi:hypothetical protein